MINKYFQLKDDIVLRGWANGDYALVNVSDGKTMPVLSCVADILYFADGSVPCDSPMISSSYKAILDKLVEFKLGDYYNEPQKAKEWQALRTSKARKVEMLHWSITGRCNLRCKHCFVDCPTSSYGELPFEKMLDILDQCVEANVPALSLTGGELFVRRDWYELFVEMKKRRLPIKTIYTNGEVVSPKLLDRIEELGIKCNFYLSYDGTNGCHDWVRNRVGVEKNTLRAIKLLKERSFEVDIETAVYKDNLSELIPTYQLMKDLGVGMLKLSPMVAGGAWNNYAKTHSATDKEVFDAYLKLIDYYKKDKNPLQIQLGGAFCSNGEKSFIPYNKKNSKSDILCSCMFKVPYLLPSGTLMPCIPMANTSIEKDMPNLLDTPLVEVLSSSAYLDIASMRLSDLKEKSSCGKCEFIESCRGSCRAVALTSASSIYGTDPTACVFWKKGYYEEFSKKTNS